MIGFGEEKNVKFFIKSFRYKLEEELLFISSLSSNIMHDKSFSIHWFVVYFVRN